MKFDLYVKDYLEKVKIERVTPGIQDGYLLSGSLQLYLATGDIEYKEFITSYLDHINDLNSLSLGKVLFYLYEETKDEKYKKAIEELVKKAEVDSKDYEDFYMLMPMYAEYGTKIWKKENYNKIMARFKDMRSKIKSDDEKEMFLMTLVETLEVMSEEIFEHYKALEVYIKELIREIEKDSTVKAYGILSGCKLKVLLKEKYQEAGSRIFDLNSETLPSNHKDVGIFMMAYAQELLLGKGESYYEV